MTLFRCSLFALVLAAFLIRPTPLSPSLRAAVQLPAPPAAASGASGLHRRRRRDARVSRRAPAGTEGAVRRVLRGRLLAAALGLPVGRGGLGCCSAHRAVGADARPRRAARPACGRCRRRSTGCSTSLVTTVLTLPLSLYEGFFREHQYGMSNQTLGPWLGDQAKGLADRRSSSAASRSIGVYAVVRRCRAPGGCGARSSRSRSPRSSALIAPVFIVPLFNKSYAPGRRARGRSRSSRSRAPTASRRRTSASSTPPSRPSA